MRFQTEMRNMSLNWIKDDLCHKVAKNLPELCSCSSVLWKELGNNEIRYLAEAFAKQAAAWLLLTAQSKM